MHTSHRAYLQWLKVALPAWAVLALLHVLTLFIPLNANAPGDNMFEAIAESADRMWRDLSDSIARRSLPDWRRQLEFGAIVGAEVLTVLGMLASFFTFRWHWAVPVVLAAVWGALTGYFVVGYGLYVRASWFDLPRFFWERLGWGFVAWYATLLLAAIVAGGLEWRRRIELRRAADTGDEFPEEQN